MINDAFQLYTSAQIQRSVNLLQAMLLQTGDIFTALITDIPAPQTYLLEIGATGRSPAVTFPLEIPMDLNKGDRITLRVREYSPDRVVMDIAFPRSPGRTDSVLQTLSPEPIPAPIHDPEQQTMAAPARRDASTLLQQLSLPPNEENIQALHQLIRFEAPVDRVTIQTLVRAVRDFQTQQPQYTPLQLTETVAFLMSRDLDPDPQTVRTITSLTRTTTAPAPPAPHGSTPIPAEAGEILKAVVSALQKTHESIVPFPTDPRVLEQRIRTVSPQSLLPADVVDVVRNLLERSPRLEALNELIRHVTEETSETPAGKTSHSVPEADKVLQSSPPLERLLEKLFPDQLEKLTVRIPELKHVRSIRELAPELIQRLTGELLGLEREEIRNTASLSAVKEAVQTSSPNQPLLETQQRLVAAQVLNQLSSLRNEGIYLFNLPVSIPGEPGQTSWVHVRVFTQSGRGKSPHPHGAFSLALNLTLSALGTVWVHAAVAQPRVAIRFKVRTPRLKNLFEKHSGSLSRTLHEMGYASTIAVDISDETDPEPEILELFQRVPPGNIYSSIDIRI